jgi:U3 small nucleolar RNA-associated protein 14
MTAITTKFAPATSLEMAIQDTLLQSGINEKKIKELETLQKRDLSEAEIAARTAQLAKMRSLFFFQEQKNKRLKKIKSKKYRKILRKAKERNQPTLAELEELDPEAAKEEHLKREKERAEERMTRKHKNTGKWAKYAASSQDPRFKEALKEHMSRGQDLLKKMNRINEDSDSEDLADEEARFRDEFLAGSISEQFDSFVYLSYANFLFIIDASESGSGDEENEADGEEEDPNYPKTGVFAMKFMKRAHDKQKAEFDQLMQDMDEEDEEWQKRMEDAVANQKGTKAANFNLDDIEVDRSEDSDEEKEREIQARKAAKDAKKNADKAQEEANRTGTGRMKFTSASTKAHSVADASASPIKLTDAERRSSKKLSANSMRLEPGSEGYSVGLSGPINVGLEAASLGFVSCKNDCTCR